MRVDNSSWFPYRTARHRAEVRLFCLPLAGASASAYRDWGAALPEGIEVWPIELPGHGTRLGEALVSDLDALLRELDSALSPFMDRPFALFGHSLGGMLAFELARALELRRGLPLRGVFISAAAAPRTMPRRPLHALSRNELREELRALGGTPLSLLEAPEFDELFLPVLRADLALLHACAHRWGPPIDAPITALLGTTDPAAPKETVTAWAQHTRGELQLAEIKGGHFFLDTSREDVLRIIDAALARWSSHESA